ncbi:heterokaryon incompatibility protein-domain-containing protein [Podospora aff. communis PSN243]|uniref:Heterokaryon incompatibility protein-domain-containing protein n=1 Tax=Podospora aff. communis PSN243 TaxID=3040156 RepID=A0AAV9GE55_9PEZI|nr:heterokaryon incompatibility protein-domain-containing protein [Podospora aff. communis PSN243]
MKQLRPSRSLPVLTTKKTLFSEPLSRYKYEPLKAARSIRLLRLIGFSVEENIIFGAMRDVILDDVRDKYLALSYTWGEAVDEHYYPPMKNAPKRLPKSPCTLVILEKPRDEYHDDIKTVRRFDQKVVSGPGTGRLSLTQNLSDFLQMSAADITHNKYEIWIDALCIDQENPEEVATQILLMRDIYGFAEQVCLWLGAADEENGESRDIANLKWLMDNALPKLIEAYHERGQEFFNVCVKVMPTAERFWERELALKPPDGITWVELWVSYFRFFSSRKWFSRAWVIQEVVLAKLTAVIVGQVVVPWQTLHRLDRFVHMPRWGQTLSLHEPRFPRNLKTQLMGYMDEYTQLGRQLHPVPQRTHGREIPAWHATLSRALMAARLKTATVAKDKVLCILGLVQRDVTEDEFAFILGQLGSLQASSQALFISCTKLLLEHGGLHMLSLVQNTYLRGIQDLPSWVIDWSVSTAWWPLFQDTTFRSTPPLQQGETCVQFADSRLLAHGMRIDKVTAAHTIYRNIDASIGPSQRFNASDAAFYPLPSVILDILSAIGPSYRDGTPIEDVLWHVLLLGSYGAQEENQDGASGSSYKPNPIDAPIMIPKRSFLEYLAFHFAASGLPNMADRARSAISTLEQAPETNLSLISCMITALNLRAKREQAGSGHFHPSPSAATFATQMIMKLKYRKLFTTEGKLTGVCSLSVEEGDEVWLLKGLAYPVVLRPQEGKYLFMGDAYVYGVMYGEVEGCDDWGRYEAIEIV